ncbi:hypothetical protein WISP_65825 [Willisornis vidua]|uniref:Secreted protein n=1 Tax=Willisornis vidua TaxID=1566151 RepID=A0ABQ9DDJ1_9PASS|nr:hypothetical protein WISP_65825 [Willisornis vidua]
MLCLMPPMARLALLAARALLTHVQLAIDQDPQSCVQVIYEDVEEHMAQEESCGTPLVTDHEPDVTPFTITLYA